MAETNIEWTDKVWNPVTGCDKISPGCKKCYANTIADRFFAKQYPPNADGSPRQFTDVRCHEDRLDIPLKWRKPSRIFVNSMSDLFHEDVPDTFIDKVFAVMALAPYHTYQVLTKRADRMLAYFSADRKALVDRWEDGAAEMGMTDEAMCFISNFVNGWSTHLGIPNDNNPLNGTVPRWPLPNVWLGVSVENQKYADERIPLLLQTPAAVRWISAEPLLGPIDFDSTCEGDPCESNFLTGIAGERIYDGRKCALDWVVAGGESGPGARPCDRRWLHNIVQQCQSAGVPVFVKQLGAKSHIDDNGSFLALTSKKGGDIAEFPEQLRVREYPQLRT